ncbi:MAG: alpha/beta fold hydrolase [Lysobacter sp.]|nr:alpha/beta fold hydrolase [Lysobacter sp.]
MVLVHGSGPQDRDSTIGPNRPLLDIARGLAERGVAVLRYEKRTKAHPQEFADGGSIDLETTDDAVRAVALLREQAGIDPKRVFVLGHSQGGMLAPRIAARDPRIAGLILLAAPSRPLLDILIEQNRRMAILNDGKTSDAESIAIQQLVDQVAAVRSGREIAAAQAPMGIAPAYWRSVDAVDQISEARAIAQPLLFLQGARDIQVVDADWQGWRDAFHDSPRATFKLYETLNHLAIPGEGDGNLQEYQTPGHVDATLIADIAAWIAAQPPK